MIETLAAKLLRDPDFEVSMLTRDSILQSLSQEELTALYEEIVRLDEQFKFDRYNYFFPDDGRYGRREYPKHMEFFRLGAIRAQRLFLAANRVGKTIAGSFEATAHATGLYKPWWEGKRFDGPTYGAAAGDTFTTTRDIIQKELFGEVTWHGSRKGFDGSGMIPGELIGKCTWKSGVADLADVVKIKYIDPRTNEWSGAWSHIGLKSYDQGRRVFQGVARHWIWLDEECPITVYGECLIRTATTDGIIMVTFTPLKGLTELVMLFLDDEEAHNTDKLAQG